MPAMNPSTIEQLAIQAQAAPPYSDPRFPPSPYYRFLEKLAGNMHPRLSIELGSCGCGGSLHLARGYSQGTVIGIDIANPYPDNVGHVLNTFPNFRFWQMDSVEAAGRVMREFGATVDILFIDTTHTYQQTMAEYRAYQRLLSDRAIVVLDDLFRRGMDRAWDRIPGTRVRLDVLHIGERTGQYGDGGFGIILHSGGH